MAKLYDQPCNQITSIVTTSGSFTPDHVFTGRRWLENTVVVKIDYAALGFKELKNYRAFGVLSLWSQIGGFVGIFLGYSLLQIPELMILTFQYAKRLFIPK